MLYQHKERGPAFAALEALNVEIVNAVNADALLTYEAALLLRHDDITTALRATNRECGRTPYAEGIGNALASALRSLALSADQRWTELLQSRYGKTAGDARYDPRRQAATPEMAEAHDTFRKFSGMYVTACQLSRADPLA